MSIRGAALVTFLGATLLLPAAFVLAMPAGGAPSFTGEQAANGRTLYVAQCASCHGGRLEGGSGPPMAGADFRQRWIGNDRPVAGLFGIIQSRMPPTAPGSLTDAQTLDILAYLLSANGYAAGGDSLTRRALATALTTPPAAPQAAPAPRPPLLATPSAPAAATGTLPSDADLLTVRDENWLTYNRDLGGRRFSPLAQITPDNVAKLQPQCLLQLGEGGAFQTGPVVFNGRMYVTTEHRTLALDAATCRQVWAHDYTPEGREPYTSNRGVALYDGKVFRGTPDGHLLALDAATGKLLWDVRAANSDLGQWIAAAPIAVDGRVFVGNAGGIFGANGFIHAFDADTGRRLWTFDLIPRGEKKGAETWKAGSQHGGGSSWTTLAYDPVRKLVYAPVGNPAAVFDGASRPGDNLYTSSVVVLDAARGTLAAHMQQTPHDTHDYDTAAAPVLFEQDGHPLMAVANKGSWLFLYDRNTHALLARQPLGRHENNMKPPSATPMRMCPGGAGGTEWNGPAYSPASRRLYVNVVDWCMWITAKPERYVEGAFFYGGEFYFDPPETAFGTLRAFDAATAKPAWVYRSPTPMLAGVTPTAGGVIFTGDLKGDFLALDERDGRVLYRFNTGGAIAGGVMTYAVDGRQYVAVASGNSSRTWNSTGSATIVVFALPDRKPR